MKRIYLAVVSIYCMISMFIDHALAAVTPAHVHGIADLQIAVDGGTLTLEFSSPLDNLLGFEHAPRSAAQVTAVRKMAQELRDAATLFIPSAAALCASTSVKLESPVLDADMLHATAGNGSAQQTTTAKNAAAEKAAAPAHADLDGEFIFNCRVPDKLRDLEVRIFDKFPNLHTVNVQVASARGQAAASLTPTEKRISW
jgi:hypothetical protein